MEIDNEREGAAERTKREWRVGKGRHRRAKVRECERERAREKERGKAGQVLLSAINTCNTTIDRRNQLLKATREGRF